LRPSLRRAHQARLATRPFFGIQPEVVNKEGEPVPAGHGGLLIIRKPWPSMARTVYGDPARYRKTYWSDVEGCYSPAMALERTPTAISG